MNYLDEQDWNKANMSKAEREYAMRKPTRAYTIGNSRTGYRTVKNYEIKDESIFLLILGAVFVFIVPLALLYI